MKGLSSGLDNLISRFSGGLAKNSAEFEKLDAATKSRINLSMKSAVGATATEIGQMTKSLSENMEPLAEKLRKIGEQKKKNLNAEEMAAKIEEERTLKTSTAMGALTKLDEQLKLSGDGAEGMKKALSTVDLSGFSDDLKAMGIDSKDAGGAIKGALEASIKGVNEGLKKAGKSGLDIGAKDIAKALKDPKELEKVRKKIDEGNQALGVAQKNAADPMTKLRTSMEQLNDTLRGKTQTAISSMMNSVFGQSLGFITTLADVGGSFAGFVFDSVLQYTQLGLTLTLLSTQMRLTTTAAGAEAVAGGAATASLWGLVSGSWASVPSLGAAAAGFWALIAPIAGAVAGFLSLIALPAAFAAAVAGIWGAFSQASKAGEKAGALFDKQMEDVTTAEYYAAKGAGFLTGWLNTVTFGLFDSFIGAEGVITKALAQFNKMIPIMSVVMMVFDAIGGVIYGIGRSISEAITGFFGMFYYIFQPIGEVFTTIGDAISTALGPLFGFSTKLSETGTIFSMFSNVFAVFGKVIGGVFRAIGQTIGFLIRIVTTVLNPAITLVGNIIGGVAAIIGTVFKSFFDWFMGAGKVLEGIATLDFSKIGSGLWEMISATFLHIPKLLLSVFSFAFKLLFIQIPQAVLGIFSQAFNLLYIQLPRFLMKLPRMIFDAIWSGLTSLASNDWVGPIFQPFLDILQPFKEAWDSLYSAFDELFKAVNLLLEPVYFLFDAIGSLFGSSEKAGESMGFLKSIIYGLSSAIGFVIKVALWPIQLLFKGLALVLQPVIWFINLLVSAISSLIKPLWSVVGTLINGFVSAISYVGEVISSIVEFISAPFKWLYNFFSSIPEKLFNALYSAASSVGLGWLFDKIAGTSGGKAKAPTETKSITEAAVAAAAQPAKTEIDVESFNRVFGAAKTQEMLNKQQLGFTQGAMANATSLTGSNLQTQYGVSQLDLLGMRDSLSASPTVATPSMGTTIDERVQRDLATSEPAMASVGGPELGQIAESEQTQVEKLTAMVDLLQQMVTHMQNPGSGGGGSDATLAGMSEIPKKPIRTYPLSTGKHMQTASKQIKNASPNG
jgi:phage-related protein